MTTPTLLVNEDAEDKNMVSVNFPSVTNCTFDLWMYESSPDFSLPDVASAHWEDRISFDFIKSQALPDGSLELEHSMPCYPAILLKTMLTPFDGGVDIVVRPVVVDSQVEETLALPLPNLCVQTVRADVFKSDPDNYQEFVGRCFIFTNDGQVFLDKTSRMKNTVCFSEDDPKSNPPIAQLYAAEWRDVPPMSDMFGSGHSTDHFKTPVIGIVSRDGEYIAAVAAKNSGLMWQAYIDCVHNIPNWDPQDGPIEERSLHTRIILMKNNLDNLLQDVHDAFGIEV
ncbi:MAG TPA: hypothetical protein ENL03_03290 [Phycisphaerae bacterium]|nr:hypothetical protein [Phycisphaerae bacterium]